MALTGILTLLVIGGIAGGAYYYRGGVQSAFAQTQKTQEEKDYDFERKQKEDTEWDESGWNPDNWFSGTKDNSKQVTKTQVTTDSLSAELRAKTDYDLVDGRIVYAETGQIVQTSGLLQSLSNDNLNLKGRRFH